MEWTSQSIGTHKNIHAESYAHTQDGAYKNLMGYGG